MHGEWIKLPDGTVAHICYSGKRRRAKPCKFCRQPSTRLCDFVIMKTLGGGEITCDAPICGACARPIGEDKDLCPDHAR
jgi:hypothetical protein